MLPCVSSLVVVTIYTDAVWQMLLLCWFFYVSGTPLGWKKKTEKLPVDKLECLWLMMFYVYCLLKVAVFLKAQWKPLFGGLLFFLLSHCPFCVCLFPEFLCPSILYEVAFAK